jgi:hypothetical protein
MIKREARRGRSRLVNALAAAVALLVLALLLSSCGSSSDEGGSNAAATTAKKGCAVGQAPTLHVTRVPKWVQERGEGTSAVVFGCFKDPNGGQVEMVGFGNWQNSHCLSVEDVRLGEPHGEICTHEKEKDTWRCKGAPGCVSAYLLIPGEMTEISGPVEPWVKQVKVLVNGKPVNGTVNLSHVSGALGKRIQVEQPAAFYAAFIRGCVKPKQVKVLMYGANGKRIGVARGWDAPINDCVKTPAPKSS